jgi:CheY-like chemotaxis protein
MPRQLALRDLLPEELAELSNMMTNPHLRMRSEIILAAAQGHIGTQIAAALDISYQRVYYWIHRFNVHGLEGLRHLTSGGRPPLHSGPMSKEILLTMFTDPHQVDPGMDHWTMASLEAYLNQKGMSITPKQLEAILRTLYLGKRSRVWEIMHQILRQRLDSILETVSMAPEARLQDSTPPRVLVIDDMATDILYAKELFLEGGFTVETAPSLRRGSRKARDLLDTTKPQRPTLILLDMMLPDQSQRSGDQVALEGFLLAADLIRKMEEGALYQAPIVAYSNDMTQTRKQNALDAGCHLALQKPLKQQDIKRLFDLVTGPSQARSVRSSLADASSQALEILHRHEAEVIWDAQAVDDLIFNPVNLFESKEGIKWQLWVEQRGGLEQIYRWMDSLVFPDPAHRRLLSAIRMRQEASAWKLHMSDVGVGRNMYYEKRRELFSLMAAQLNASRNEE